MSFKTYFDDHSKHFPNAAQLTPKKTSVDSSIKFPDRHVFRFPKFSTEISFRKTENTQTVLLRDFCFTGIQTHGIQTQVKSDHRVGVFQNNWKAQKLKNAENLLCVLKISRNTSTKVWSSQLPSYHKSSRQRARRHCLSLKLENIRASVCLMRSPKIKDTKK